VVDGCCALSWLSFVADSIFLAAGRYMKRFVGRWELCVFVTGMESVSRAPDDDDLFGPDLWSFIFLGIPVSVGRRPRSAGEPVVASGWLSV